jgi:single-strand DNA-binding protein
MADLGNSCQFIGNLGNEPEMSFLQDGTARARFRLAVNGRTKNPVDNSQIETTMWVRVTAFGKQAELVGERLHKGSRVLTRGRLGHQEWIGNDGQKRFDLDLLLRDIEFFDARRESGSELETTVAGAGDDL